MKFRGIFSVSVLEIGTKRFDRCFFFVASTGFETRGRRFSFPNRHELSLLAWKNKANVIPRNTVTIISEPGHSSFQK